jgi:hypothetical protein
VSLAIFKTPCSEFMSETPDYKGPELHRSRKPRLHIHVASCNHNRYQIPHFRKTLQARSATILLVLLHTKDVLPRRDMTTILQCLSSVSILERPPLTLALNATHASPTPHAPRKPQVASRQLPNVQSVRNMTPVLGCVPCPPGLCPGPRTPSKSRQRHCAKICNPEVREVGSMLRLADIGR